MYQTHEARLAMRCDTIRVRETYVQCALCMRACVLMCLPAQYEFAVGNDFSATGFSLHSASMCNSKLVGIPFQECVHLHNNKFFNYNAMPKPVLCCAVIKNKL